MENVIIRYKNWWGGRKPKSIQYENQNLQLTIDDKSPQNAIRVSSEYKSVSFCLRYGVIQFSWLRYSDLMSSNTLSPFSFPYPICISPYKAYYEFSHVKIKEL